MNPRYDKLFDIMYGSNISLSSKCQQATALFEEVKQQNHGVLNLSEDKDPTADHTFIINEAVNLNQPEIAQMLTELLLKEKVKLNFYEMFNVEFDGFNNFLPFLLKKIDDINQNPKSHSALYSAVYHYCRNQKSHTYLSIMEQLIDANANVNAQYWGANPLIQLASQKEGYFFCQPIMQKLLAAGADHTVGYSSSWSRRQREQICNRIKDNEVITLVHPYQLQILLHDIFISNLYLIPPLIYLIQEYLKGDYPSLVSHEEKGSSSKMKLFFSSTNPDLILIKAYLIGYKNHITDGKRNEK